MVNVIVTLIIAALLFAAIRFIIKEKKRGVKCIGCPAAGQCASKNGVKDGYGRSCDCSMTNER